MSGAIIIFLLTALVGGTGASLVKFSVGIFPPITLVVLRSLLALLFIAPIVFLKKSFVVKDQKIYLLIANILFAANWLFFAFGMQYTSVIMGQIIYLPTAPVVAILGYLFLKEKLTDEQLIGLTLTLFGMGFLIFGSFKSQDILSFGTPQGNLLVIAGLFCWSIYTVVSRKISTVYSPLSITFFNFVASFVISALLVPIELAKKSFSISDVPASGFVGLASLVLLSSILFFYLYQWLIKNTSAFTSSLVLYVVTILAVLSGIIFFDEKLSFSLVIGAFLVVAGVFFATSYKLSRAKNP